MNLLRLFDRDAARDRQDSTAPLAQPVAELRTMHPGRALENLSAALADDIRQQQERGLAPIMWIQSGETMLPPPKPVRHEWRRRDRA